MADHQQEQERFARLEAIFLQADSMPAEQRTAYLQSACGDNDLLREQVEKLLRHEETESAGADLRDQFGRVIPQFGGSSPDLKIGQDLRGYQITREINRGGQGIVYQAIQQSTKRKVAIKVIREGSFAAPCDRARFTREVQTLAALDHPNIVTVLDRGETPNGAYFFVMDYISGEPLDHYIAAHREKRPSTPDDLSELLRLFIKIADAVNAAHLRGIVHRDLKPSNIKVDARGEPHILDFGLARLPFAFVTDESHPQAVTITGQFLGSLPWASPEQAEGIPSKIDIRTDVYSLGVILYHMLTNKFPYEVIGTVREVLNNILTTEPTPPSRIALIADQPIKGRSWWHRRAKRCRAAIDEQVEAIVLKALEKDLEHRYGSAGDFARDVADYLAGKPIAATGHSARQRHTILRWSACAAGAVLTLIAVGVLLTAGVLRRPGAPSESGEGHKTDVIVSAPVHSREESPRRHEATIVDYMAVQEQQASRSMLATDEVARQQAATLLDDAGTAKALGDKTEARRLYRQAITILEPLTASHPDDVAAQLTLVAACKKLRDTFSTGERDYALFCWLYERTITSLERALAKRPSDPSLLDQLASACKQGGYVARQMGRGQVALRMAEKRVFALRKLSEVVDSSPDIAPRLINGNMHLAETLSAVGRSAEAIDQLRDSIADAEQSVQETPDEPQLQKALAALYLRRALWNDSFNLNEAIRDSEKAKTIFHRLEADSSEEAAWAYETHARLLRQADRADEARVAESSLLEHARRSVDRDINNPYRADRYACACLLAADGALADNDHAKALKLGREAQTIREELVSSYPLEPGFKKHLSHTYSRLAEYTRAAGQIETAEEYENKARQMAAQATGQFLPPEPVVEDRERPAD